MDAQEAIKLICETLVAAFGNAAEKTLPVTARAEKVGCVTQVICPKYGEKITIEATE